MTSSLFSEINQVSIEVRKERINGKQETNAEIECVINVNGGDWLMIKEMKMRILDQILWKNDIRLNRGRENKERNCLEPAVV